MHADCVPAAIRHLFPLLAGEQRAIVTENRPDYLTRRPAEDALLNGYRWLPEPARADLRE